MCLSLIPKKSEIEIITKKVIKRIDDIAKINIKEKYWISHYGANEINQKNLVIWICVKSDKEKQRLQDNNELVQLMRCALNDEHYPSEGINGVHIGFESQETVDRDSNGNWFYHWK